MTDVFTDIDTYTFIYGCNLHKLADSSKDANEQAVFRLLGNAMSLHHDVKKENAPFGSAVLNNGQPLSVSDFKDEDLDNLRLIIDDLSRPILIARISDLLWTVRKDYICAVKAVGAYKECAKSTFDKENWSTYFSFIKKANRIALQLGKNHSSNSFLDLCTYIDSVIKEIDGTDTLFLSINMIGLMIDNGFNKLQDYVVFVNKIIDDACQKNNISRAESAFDLKIKLLRKLKNDEGVLIAQNDYATYMEGLARDYISKDSISDLQHAIHFFESAVLLYRNANRPDDVKRIRLEMDSLKSEYVKKMPVMSHEVDRTQEYIKLKDFLCQRSLQEKIMILGMLTHFPTKQELENEVLQSHSEFFFSKLFTTTLLDSGGKIIAHIPPLDINDPKSNHALFEKHMLHMMTRIQDLSALSFMGMVLSIIQNEHKGIVANDMDFLVDHNWFIPDNRKHIFKTGFALGLNGDYYSALHLLVPQVENLFRELVKSCGGLVTNFNENRTEEWKLMTSIFNSEELIDCYDENLLFMFKGLLIEDTGANLRNKIAHGMICSIEGNGNLSKYFLSAVIKLCSWYSKNCYPMLSSLHDELDAFLVNEIPSKK